MHTFDDFGLGERSLWDFSGGDFDTDFRDRLYRSLERERDVLLPDEETLGLRLVHLAAGGFSWLGEGEGLLVVGFFLSDWVDFSAALDLSTLLEELEALLLLEELPEEEPDELAELEREPDLLELPALLCDEELCRKQYAWFVFISK